MTWPLNINLLLENSPDPIHMKGFQLQGWLGLDKTFDLDARKLIFQKYNNDETFFTLEWKIIIDNTPEAMKK